jgi:hypothetical protein
MSNQTAAWGDIHADHKTEDVDGTRWVLDHVDGVGTCLVRWHGPTLIGPDGFTRLAGERHPSPLPLHRTEAGYPNCATCDGGGCLDC